MGTQAFYLVLNFSVLGTRYSVLGTRGSLEETQNFESRAWGLRDGKGVGGLSPAPRRAGGRGGDARGASRIASRSKLHDAEGYTPSRVARRARLHDAQGYMTPNAARRAKRHDAESYMTLFGQTQMIIVCVSIPSKYRAKYSGPSDNHRLWRCRRNMPK